MGSPISGQGPIPNFHQPTINEQGGETTKAERKAEIESAAGVEKKHGNAQSGPVETTNLVRELTKNYNESTKKSSVLAAHVFSESPSDKLHLEAVDLAFKKNMIGAFKHQN